MMIIQRSFAPAINALFITCGLLLLMYQLVKVETPDLQISRVFTIDPFSVTAEDEPPVRLIQAPEKLTEPELPPEISLTHEPPTVEPIEGGLNMAKYVPTIGEGLRLPDNAQLVLTLAYPSDYPGPAIARGIEGYAIVGFSVATSGAVFDAFIIESEPGSTFDRASLKAISKFKYNPKMVNGKAVVADGQRYQFTYKLDED